MNKEHLIYGHLFKSLTLEEEQIFANLLKNDESFKREVAQISELWSASENIPFEDTYNVGEAWNSFEEKINNKQNKKIIHPNHWKLLYRVAAVVLLVLSSLFVFNQFNEDSFTAGLVYESSENQQVCGLIDGSHVYLDNQSKLKIDKQFNASDRKMRLDGKAFFVVKPDKDRAFEVATNHLTATVKGTTFLVRTDDHSSTVGVKTGIVEVHVGNQTVLLTAGDQLDFSDGNGGVVSRSNLDDSSITVLQKNALDYYDTPLNVILSDLKNSLGLEVLAPKSIENERFTMQLSNASKDEIIKTIETITHRKAILKNNTYTLI